jgi:hypothetical protein
MENPNETQPPLMPPIQSTPTKKWYADKAVLTILVLVILAGLSLTVYFIVNQPQNLGPIVFNHKSTKVAPIQNGNLKSFTNSRYGYEIQYPTDWMTEGSNDIIFLYTNQTSSNSPSSLGVAVYTTNTNDPVSWFTTNTYTKTDGLTEKPNITIGGISGVGFCHPLSATKIQEDWIIIHAGYVYDFGASWPTCNLSNTTINDILDTFKFTTNTSSSSTSSQSPNWSDFQQYTIFSLRVPSYTPNGFYWEGPTNLIIGEKISGINLTLKSDNNPSQVMVYEQSTDPAKAANKDLLNVTDSNYTSQGFKVSHVAINENDALLATAYEGMTTQMVHLRFFLKGTEVFLNADGGNGLSVNDIINIARSMK